MNEQNSVGTIIGFWSALLIVVFIMMYKNLTSTDTKTVGGTYKEFNEAVDGNR